MSYRMRSGMPGPLARQTLPSLGAGCLLAAVALQSPIANGATTADAIPAGGAPIVVDAAADPAASAGPWSGNVRLGYLANSGNTETENVNFGFEVAYAIERWVHSLAGSAVGASDDNTTTAEAYTLGWKSTYDLTERDYLFGRVDWLKDKFSGFDEQLSEAIGYGRRLILQPHQTLSVEIGPGARQSELRTGEEEKELILALGSYYEYNFNENARFNFDVGMQMGEENTFTEAVAALRTKLVGDLSAVLSYTVRNNTDVPDDSEETDTMTAVALEYLF